MQFNFVVVSNEPAVMLWRKLGFEIVGRVPEAFRHPSLGLVDALVMYRSWMFNLFGKKCNGAALLLRNRYMCWRKPGLC